MSEQEKPPELDDAALENLLNVWLKKQIPWDLQSAICLLVKRDPDHDYYKSNPISFHKKAEYDYETRAFTHVLQSINDPTQDIAHVGSFKSHASQSQIDLASDYKVYKKVFIAWADTEWDDDACHLTDALKRYEKASKYGKKHASQEKAKLRQSAHEEALGRVSMQLSNAKQKSLAFYEFKHRMEKEIKEIGHQKVYGETLLRGYFKKLQGE